MYSNLSATFKETTVNYPISDSSLPFSEYIARSRLLVEERRPDLQNVSQDLANIIINANVPFELYPTNPIKTNGRLKYGVLLIHGLLDCPFTLKDLGHKLQADGMLCRSILLPGHGTTPSDLLNITYHDWVQAVRYGVDSMRNEVDQLFLVGYSTGAALSIYQALQDSQISGIILLAPAIKLKAPVDIVVGWHYLMRELRQHKDWLYVHKEIDYAKYMSIPFNAVKQVSALTKVVKELQAEHQLSCPLLMVMSREDETISSHEAINFFSELSNPGSQILLYTSCERAHPDPRISTRLTHYPHLALNHFSHISIPFAPDNAHYGEQGDYCFASRLNAKGIVYGAYNQIEIDFFNILYHLKLIKEKRRELTYNPDFQFMAEKISQFILT